MGLLTWCFLLRDAEVEVDPQESTSDFVVSPSRSFCSIGSIEQLCISKPISKKAIPPSICTFQGVKVSGYYVVAFSVLNVVESSTVLRGSP